MRFPVFIVLALLLAACAPQAQAPSGGGLQVVASNPIIADVASQVGGEHVSVAALVPAGVDPHAFEATPQDIARLDGAALIFINGLGLEDSLESLLHEAEETGKVVVVSAGIEPLGFEDDHAHEDEHGHEGEHDDHEHEGEHDDHEHEGEHDGDEHQHHGEDPHVWWNPANIQVWVDNIAAALSAADPANAAAYQANAEAYKAELAALDGWIAEQVDGVPTANRQLVVDHQSLNYFAAAYGFESVGALVSSFSTLSEASAGELAELEHAMEHLGVRAIFVGNSANPALAERVSADTGVQVVPLYIETLSTAEGPAATYLEMMRYNVSAIVEALK